MNNSLLTFTKSGTKNISASYFKNFSLAQINLELNRQEDYFNEFSLRNSGQKAIKKGFTKEA
jgi:hypothetical protein